MQERAYNAGDTILKEGDPSDSAYGILSGEVEVFTEFDGETVILGVLKAGEFLGEMGIVDGQPWSASARARNRVSLRVFEKKEFSQLISQDSLSGHLMITRHCEKMRTIIRRLAERAAKMKIADTIEEQAQFIIPQDRAVEAESKSESTSFRFTLLPASPGLAPTLPEEGMTIMNLPFSVGRLPEKRDPGLSMFIDLRFPDKRPFRLSRKHFALDQDPDGYGIVDLGSTLGTQVNGEFLGRHFGKDFEYLKPGENQIVAGGLGSPFVFKVLMEPA